MIDRTEARFGLKPQRLVGDSAYGTAPMLGWMVKDKDIAPHVPVWARSERKDGTLSSSDSRGMSRATNTAAPKDMQC